MDEDWRERELRKLNSEIEKIKGRQKIYKRFIANKSRTLRDLGWYPNINIRNLEKEFIKHRNYDYRILSSQKAVRQNVLRGKWKDYMNEKYKQFEYFYSSIEMYDKDDLKKETYDDDDETYGNNEEIQVQDYNLDTFLETKKDSFIFITVHKYGDKKAHLIAAAKRGDAIYFFDPNGFTEKSNIYLEKISTHIKSKYEKRVFLDFFDRNINFSTASGGHCFFISLFFIHLTTLNADKTIRFIKEYLYSTPDLPDIILSYSYNMLTTFIPDFEPKVTVRGDLSRNEEKFYELEKEQDILNRLITIYNKYLESEDFLMKNGIKRY